MNPTDVQSNVASVDSSDDHSRRSVQVDFWTAEVGVPVKIGITSSANIRREWRDCSWVKVPQAKAQIT